MFLIRLLTSLTALSCLRSPERRTSRRRQRRARVLGLRLRRKIASETHAATHSSHDPTLHESVSSDQLEGSTGSQLQISSRPSLVLASGSAVAHVDSAPSERALRCHQDESNITSSVKTESASTEQPAFSCNSLKDDGINSVHDSGIQLDCSQAEGEEIRPRDVELEDKEVELEALVVAKDGSIVTGYVRVRNETYEKRVVVRHTQNEWSTYQDTAAEWMESLKGGKCDRFLFQLNLSKGSFAVHLAIEATQNENTAWDNNCGNNYYIIC